MILEIAHLQVKAGELAAFEAAMQKAKLIIAKIPGFNGLEVRHSISNKGDYLLQVHWQKLEDHTEGFRRSTEYQEWRALLHPFYEPMPTVEYFEAPFAVA